MENKTIKELFKCKYEVGDEKGLYSLQLWYNQLIDKKISEINMPDVLRMLRQNIFIEIAIKKSIKYLMIDPFVGEQYQGELLITLSKLNMSYLYKYKKELKDILKKALVDNGSYGWILEEDRKEFAEVILNFMNKISRCDCKA